MPSLAGVEIDPAHLMTSISRFYTLAAEGSFDEISIPEMSSTQRQTAAGRDRADGSQGRLPEQLRRPRWRTACCATRRAGRSRSAAARRRARNSSSSIEKAEADRIDIGAFARIFDASAYRDGRGDNIWRPLVSRVVYGKMTGRGADGATFGFDEIAIENVDGRQPEKPFTDMWDRLMDPSVPQDVKNDLALDAVTSMIAAWRVGTIRVDGISVEAPKENASFSLDSFSMTGWSSAGLDSLLLEEPRAAAARKASSRLGRSSSPASSRRT